ncbi:MAG: erythromycin esterase family protein [Pseudonocardiaceae bacterium]
MRCVRGAQHVLEFLTHGLYRSPGRSLRNEVLAENLRWVLDHEDRVVVGAHNVHLQRSPRRRILTIPPGWRWSPDLATAWERLPALHPAKDQQPPELVPLARTPDPLRWL